MDEKPIVDHIKELETRIEDLKARLPAHSIPPRMIAELDDLEDELAAARSVQDISNGVSDAAGGGRS